MFGLMGVLGLICLVAGLAARSKGQAQGGRPDSLNRRDRVGDQAVKPKQAANLMSVGVFLLVGGLAGSLFDTKGASVLAFLSWTFLCVGGYGLIKGNVGPLRGRRFSAGVVAASLILLSGAFTVQSSSEKAVAARRAASEAAAAEERYQVALGLAKDGKWEAAADSFEQLGGYKDAQAHHTEALYQHGRALAMAAEWRLAQDVLQRLPEGYQDVQALRVQVRDGLSEQLYQDALIAMGRKDYARANALLQDAKTTGGKISGDLDASIMAVRDGLSEQLYHDALTARDQEDYARSESLLQEAKAAGGKTSSDLDAELATVRALRAEAEAAAAARAAEARARQARIEAEAGPEPENSAWDGAVYPVTQFLKANLKDPKSVEYIEWSPVQLLEWDGEYAWAVRCKYRAKNSFGGYVIEERVFFMQHERVVDYMDY